MAAAAEACVLTEVRRHLSEGTGSLRILVTTILVGVQIFLRGVFRDAVYPVDIWHGDATYPRIFCRGVPKIEGVELSYRAFSITSFCVKIMT